ncbi:hypothetical protein M8C21_022142 [Ambrosia artemisiifolia]|uniref:Uncharacterized protein n=1 Tax=Ambrosia artemisiifolia TaxID=4212 RepID=A0AAD5CHF6_AMBAR|nr:hypothetical protein M8C21_022142 [Ambrosia artemisiifolia]
MILAVILVSFASFVAMFIAVLADAGNYLQEVKTTPEHELMGRLAYEHVNEPANILIEAELPASVVDVPLRVAHKFLVANCRYLSLFLSSRKLMLTYHSIKLVYGCVCWCLVVLTIGCRMLALTPTAKIHITTPQKDNYFNSKIPETDLQKVSRTTVSTTKTTQSRASQCVAFTALDTVMCEFNLC